MKILICFVGAAVIGSMQLSTAQSVGGILGSTVNDRTEEYAPIVVQGSTTDTLFFTSSRTVEGKIEKALNADMFYSVRPAVERRNRTPINEGWSQAALLPGRNNKFSQSTQGSFAIGKERIVYSGEREIAKGNTAVQGTSFLLDLWEMTRTDSGFSPPRSLESINDPDAWDAQPALSTDGKVLFFVSNRSGGKGGLDIWCSQRDAAGNWQKAFPLEDINTAGDEFSPHAGADGKFYFSTDWNYSSGMKSSTKKDIHRADYHIKMGLSLPYNPLNIDEAIRSDASKYGNNDFSELQINSVSDDEFPYISPDRQSLFFTSNRSSGEGLRDIYAYSLPKSKVRLQVNVAERVLSVSDEEIIPPTPKFGIPLIVTNTATGVSIEIPSGSVGEIDADAVYSIQFSPIVEKECYQNQVQGIEKIMLTTKKPYGSDTLHIRSFVLTKKQMEIKPIIFYSTDTLPYFITGYWHPTTSENLRIFRERERNGFFNQTGFVDSSGHEYWKTASIIDREFEEQVYKPLDNVLPLMQDFCGDTLYLKVTIHGYTDPRQLSSGEKHPYRQMDRLARIYPDKNVTVGEDERKKEVAIPTGHDMHRWRYRADSSSQRYVQLPDSGQKGNVLLSKLRAYFMFSTFDEQMKKRSPLYKQLAENHRIIVDPEGFGIDKDGLRQRNLRDDPQSRRIEVYIDILRKHELPDHRRMKNGTLIAAKPKHKRTAASSSMQNVESGAKTETPVPVSNNLTDRSLSESNVQSKPMLQTECYSIQYTSTTSQQDAEQTVNILKSNGVENPRVEMTLDVGGVKRYRVSSSCYSTAEEAVNILQSQTAWLQTALKLRQKPFIVR